MKLTITTFLLTVSVIVFSQNKQSFTSFIQLDTSIQWAAECDKVINLTPKVKEYSLKKWYTEKVKNSSVTAYHLNADKRSVSSYQLSLPGLQVPDWLKGLAIELSPHRFPQEWYFFDPSMPADDYNRYKARAGKLNLAADSCCGCDEADAFRAKQVVTYKSGTFSIYNVFISPLCARKTASPPSDWYPLCNVAYNNNPAAKLPSGSNEVVLLNTDYLDYDFSKARIWPYDSVLTQSRPSLIYLLMKDYYDGKIKMTDYETRELIAANDLLTWKMNTDTIPVYDIMDPTKLDRYEVVKTSRNPDKLGRLRIIQDHWFDFKNEKLYSEIKEVILMEAVMSVGNTLIGYRPFCIINFY